MNVPSSPGSSQKSRTISETAVDQFWDSFYPDLLGFARKRIAKHNWNGLAQPDAQDIAQGAAERLLSGRTTKHWQRKIAEIEAPESIREQIAAELRRLVRLEVDQCRPGRRIENTKHVALLNNDHYDAIKAAKPEQLVGAVTEDFAAQSSLEGMLRQHPAAAIDYRAMLEQVRDDCGDQELRKICEYLLTKTANGALPWTELGRHLGIPKILNTRRRFKTELPKWYATNLQ
jgi:predicted transcriptional regulator